MHASFRLSNQDAQREGVGEEKEDSRIGELIASFVCTVQYPQVPALMDHEEDPPFPLLATGPIHRNHQELGFLPSVYLVPVATKNPCRERETGHDG